MSVRFLTVQSTDREVTYRVSALKSLTVIRRASPVPGVITDGVARNGVTYHVRAPKSYAREKPVPAIVILHGSNMNSRTYVSTIVHAWPDLAARYLLIGINGEQRRPDSAPEAPAYNYTYVNYAGRSTYKAEPFASLTGIFPAKVTSNV